MLLSASRLLCLVAILGTAHAQPAVIETGGCIAINACRESDLAFVPSPSPAYGQVITNSGDLTRLNSITATWRNLNGAAGNFEYVVFPFTPTDPNNIKAGGVRGDTPVALGFGTNLVIPAGAAGSLVTTKVDITLDIAKGTYVLWLFAPTSNPANFKLVTMVSDSGGPDPYPAGQLLRRTTTDPPKTYLPFILNFGGVGPGLNTVAVTNLAMSLAFGPSPDINLKPVKVITGKSWSFKGKVVPDDPIDIPTAVLQGGPSTSGIVPIDGTALAGSIPGGVVVSIIPTTGSLVTPMDQVVFLSSSCTGNAARTKFTCKQGGSRLVISLKTQGTTTTVTFSATLKKRTNVRAVAPVQVAVTFPGAGQTFFGTASNCKTTPRSLVCKR